MKERDETLVTPTALPTTFYFERMVAVESEVEGITLNDLYLEKVVYI